MLARARWLLRRSLTYRLIASYLVILGIGGLVTSLVGSWIVSSTLLDLERRTATHDLTTASTVYTSRLHDVRRIVEMTAGGAGLRAAVLAGDTALIRRDLGSIRSRSGLDFLAITNAAGRVQLRATPSAVHGDDASAITVVQAALGGEVSAGTEILAADQLGREDPALVERARIDIVPTARARNGGRTVETSGMVQLAAAPIVAEAGRPAGVLYGGRLLSRDFALVDYMLGVIHGGGHLRPDRVGVVTLFQGDLRISTNVREDGARVLGTLASAAVAENVLDRGMTWNARAFVVHDWYMSAYEPIRNHAGEIIGMLYVGLPEHLFTAARDRVLVSFFAIALCAFIGIIVTTYFMTRSMTKPLEEMAAATRRISAGEFDVTVHQDAPGEIGVLAESFNSMLAGLRQMKSDLEDWGRTLERRVAQRSEEVMTMQSRVAESDRLASLGMLAAGVAHEINNPMGGILALTSLALEDMPADDPHRSNLEEVVRQTERCRDIVRGLLEFSRQSHTDTELVSMNQVVRSTLLLISNQALFHNVRVVEMLAPDLPWVTAQRSQLEQVCMNLVVNAAQSLAGAGTVTIETLHHTDLDQVELRVSDTGRGIEQDKINRIFDPFFTTKDDGHGTGLGLSIAYGIVTKHGGSISVESEVGTGSTFIVRFPVAYPAEVT
jgi:two-component system, NtrC family, sensor kinase